jgi:hypothetical protein
METTMANSSNFYQASADWTSAQHEAAAAALGFQAYLVAYTVRELAPKYPDMDFISETILAGRLARAAGHHAALAEREDERMGRVLMAQVSFGHGPALTPEEIERANAAHCHACSSIPCRCGGN